MDSVGAEVDRTSRANEVTHADAELWCEVPDTCIGVGAIIVGVVGWTTEGGIFVVGPQKASCSLHPW